MRFMDYCTAVGIGAQKNGIARHDAMKQNTEDEGVGEGVLAPSTRGAVVVVH